MDESNLSDGDSLGDGRMGLDKDNVISGLQAI